ncbi:MAG TPA: efflux transporter outer membrane subunit [Rhodanobacteraceae bacterium]|nr:efflux transporter outer membrane subunit [Rhodanobacteraceae bacterium]
MRTLRTAMLSAACSVALAACMVGPDYHRPEVAVPAAYGYQTAAAVEAEALAWWKQLGDPVLDDLIDKSLAQNKDLAVAAARVDEFYGRFMSTRSSLFPQLGGDFNAGRSRTPATRLTPAFETTQIQADLRASWELDLFGRLRRLTESARADLMSSEYARQATRISLVASVASGYILLRDLDQRLAIARSTLESRKGAADLFHLRFKGGVVSEVQVAQADSEYASATASVASFQQQVKFQENALALLLGENPGPIPRGKTIDEIVAPAIPAGLPSALLDRRPDIRLAEEQLHSANAQIGAARAQYFPTISLTGLFGSASDALSGLWEGPAEVWSYAGAAAMPIFTGGGIAGSVKAAEARQQEALFQYQAAIQNAFADVDNSLTGVARTKEQLVATDAQVRALAQYAKLSRDLYEGGYVSYLEVLDAERNLFNAQLSQASLQDAYLGQIINVYKALGYGWPVDETAIAERGTPANREIDRIRASETH